MLSKKYKVSRSLSKICITVISITNITIINNKCIYTSWCYEYSRMQLQCMSKVTVSCETVKSTTDNPCMEWKEGQSAVALNPRVMMMMMMMVILLEATTILDCIDWTVDPPPPTHLTAPLICDFISTAHTHSNEEVLFIQWFIIIILSIILPTVHSSSRTSIQSPSSSINCSSHRALDSSRLHRHDSS